MKFKYHFYFIVCSIVLLCVACKKEYSYEKGPPNQEIITVGVEYNYNNSRNNAVYWNNSSIFYVEPLATDNTIAFSVEKWSKDLIISGGCSLQNEWKPCYWVNGKRYTLPLPTTWNLSGYYGVDIKIYNNTLYILAKINNVNSFIWKIANVGAVPQIIELKEPNNFSTANNKLSATNMVIYNNRLMVFGSYIANFDTPTPHNSQQPCIWEIDTLNNINVDIPENNASVEFNTTWGDVTFNGLYMIGNNNRDSIMIWNENNRIATISEPELDINYRSSFCKMDDNGNLHILCARYNLLPPKLYTINTQEQIIVETIVSTPVSNNNTFVFGLDIKDNIYALGISYSNPINKFHSFINKINNSSTILNDISVISNTNNTSAYPRCTRIFPK